jgi:hypothetical protein
MAKQNLLSPMYTVLTKNRQHRLLRLGLTPMHMNGEAMMEVANQ